MKRKINAKHSYDNFSSHPSLMKLSLNQNKEKHLKPFKEWIYGSLNFIGDNSIMTFKNQKAFNGYQKKRIDLCRYILLFNILIFIFFIIVQIKNISKRFELREISDNFYRKLFNIYKKSNYPIQLKQSLKNYKIIDKNPDNRNNFRHNRSRSLPYIKQRGKN